ncbi:hypothetical protein OH76DRAFT_1410240 [Lentinus brumalis]|uniref:Uncharacterized protein n=1 Tax=Lentinus brumalis TaxID=2498619 RepID=A0A371CSR7_9APHY|nr:hypothetical protein OH76DRAFT_1410240 [Polyporus brumalis]
MQPRFPRLAASASLPPFTLRCALCARRLLVRNPSRICDACPKSSQLSVSFPPGYTDQREAGLRPPTNTRYVINQSTYSILQRHAPSTRWINRSSAAIQASSAARNGHLRAAADAQDRSVLR